MSIDRLEPMEPTAAELAASLVDMLDILCNSLNSGTDTSSIAELARNTANKLMNKIERERLNINSVSN